MNVLVTGGNGQLAKTIKLLFESNKDGVKFHFKTKKELNITSEKEVISVFSKKSYDYCINCAAYTKVDDAETEENKALLINSKGPKNLAKACKKNSTKLVHLSTDYVFTGDTKKPYKETDETNPTSKYGLSKLKGENLVKSNIDEYFIIRTAWLYSSFQGNFLNTILEKIQKEEELNVVNSQKGSPTSCNELSRFIYFLIKNKTLDFGTYNFTCTGETTWYGFAKEIVSYFPEYKTDKLQPVNSFPSKAKRPKYSVLSLKKTKEIYPNIKSWKKALQEVLKQIDTLHL